MNFPIRQINTVSAFLRFQVSLIPRRRIGTTQDYCPLSPSNSNLKKKVLAICGVKLPMINVLLVKNLSEKIGEKVISPNE